MISILKNNIFFIVLITVSIWQLYKEKKIYKKIQEDIKIIKENIC